VLAGARLDTDTDDAELGTSEMRGACDMRGCIEWGGCDTNSELPGESGS
jgi:hypothetical protein